MWDSRSDSWRARVTIMTKKERMELISRKNLAGALSTDSRRPCRQRKQQPLVLIRIREGRVDNAKEILSLNRLF